jgi:hemerythrin-like domain-containing protein
MHVKNSVEKKTKQAKGRKAAAHKAQAVSAEADAISLLKQDHAEVKAIFEEFRQLVENGGRGQSEQEKYELVRKACDMLIIHTLIEEQIFYPAVRRAADEEEVTEVMNEAEVEHNGAKDLIAQLRHMRPGERLYDATFIVLGEMVKHHIREEERKMFPKAKKSGVDLARLGQDIAAFKEELEEDRKSHYGESLSSAGRMGGMAQQRGRSERPAVYN